ncbi:MAG: hypothetical protein JO183_04505 [Ktedonobacteraceae bacterium]|nr:hypothetical protein [Ktedonobacteraceae bacterium]
MPPGSNPFQRKRRKAQTGGTASSDALLPTTNGKIPLPITQHLHQEDDYPEPPRSGTSIVRLNNPVPPRTTGSQPSAIPPRRQQRGRDSSSPRLRTTTQQHKTERKVHWLLPLGIGMVAMLVLWVTASWLLAWATQRYDDIRYGIPRTYQTDAVVGHGGDSAEHPSHFIALNLNRQAVVIELMAGDPAKSFTYVVPFYIVAQDADLTPITVEFRDVTGNHRKDMIIHIHLHSQDQTFVFVNDGTKFRPPNANDTIHL